MSSDIEIANKALHLLGSSRQIASLQEAPTVETFLESTIRSELEKYEWNFAKVTSIINPAPLTNITEYKEIYKWPYSPCEALAIRYVGNDLNPDKLYGHCKSGIDWEVMTICSDCCEGEEKVIVSDLGGSIPIQYTGRVKTSLFSESFIIAVAHRIASFSASSKTSNSTQASDLNNKANQLMAEARMVDSAQSNRKKNRFKTTNKVAVDRERM